MKEIQDANQLKSYLQTHRLDAIFHEPLFPHLSLFAFDQGELICSQGESAEMLYVLVKGKIKIYTTSAEGRALILSFKTPLEVIGDIEFIRETDIMNTVEAVSPLHMIGIPNRTLRQYGINHAPLLHFLLDIITKKFYIKNHTMSLNLLHPVEVRLASYLLSVSYDESDARFQGQLRTDSLMDAANLIGTSYRHLNRVIRQFCEDGLLERTRGILHVMNRVGLSARANHNIYELPEEYQR
jgi:CRP-like cAMP-binding protein